MGFATLTILDTCDHTA